MKPLKLPLRWILSDFQICGQYHIHTYTSTSFTYLHIIYNLNRPSQCLSQRLRLPLHRPRAPNNLRSGQLVRDFPIQDETRTGRSSSLPGSGEFRCPVYRLSVEEQKIERRRNAAMVVMAPTRITCIGLSPQQAIIEAPHIQPPTFASGSIYL
jgi:hypothetical protein